MWRHNLKALLHWAYLLRHCLIRKTLHLWYHIAALAFWSWSVFVMIGARLSFRWEIITRWLSSISLRLDRYSYVFLWYLQVCRLWEKYGILLFYHAVVPVLTFLILTDGIHLILLWMWGLAVTLGQTTLKVILRGIQAQIQIIVLLDSLGERSWHMVFFFKVHLTAVAALLFGLRGHCCDCEFR